jgi:hypothetical protein
MADALRFMMPPIGGWRRAKKAPARSTPAGPAASRFALPGPRPQPIRRAAGAFDGFDRRRDVRVQLVCGVVRMRVFADALPE